MREKPGLEKPNTSKKSAEESAPGLPASGLAPTASYGTPGTTRTYDLRIRSPLLYPAELQARILIFNKLRAYCEYGICINRRIVGVWA